MGWIALRRDGEFQSSEPGAKGQRELISGAPIAQVIFLV
jgi:hypothetical protein